MMPGLIRAEFKRLSKSRSLIVCIIISVLLGVSMTLLYNYFWEQKGDKIAMSYALMRQYGLNTELLDNALSSLPENNFWSYTNIFFTDGGIWLISAACVCAFLSSEYAMGTLKNSIVRGCRKTDVYFSKLIAGIINTLIVAAAYVGSGAVTAFFIVDRSTKVTGGQIALILVNYLLLLAAASSLFLMLCVIFRRTGFAAAAAIAAPMLISSLLNIITSINEDAAGLSKYLLMESFISVQPSVISGQWFAPAVTAAVYISLTTTAGLIIFNRSEIK